MTIPYLAPAMSLVVHTSVDCMKHKEHFSRLPDDVKGTTTLEFRLARKGDAASVEVLKTSGDAELDAEAVACFRQSVFLAPAMSLLPGGDTSEKRFPFPILWHAMREMAKQPPGFLNVPSPPAE